MEKLKKIKIVLSIVEILIVVLVFALSIAGFIPREVRPFPILLFMITQFAFHFVETRQNPAKGKGTKLHALLLLVFAIAVLVFLIIALAMGVPFVSAPAPTAIA